jgi:hypothetical protein
MAIMVLEVVALVFAGIECLIGNLPPGATAPHEVKDMALVHPSVRHPTAVLALVSAQFPVLDKIDPHVWVGGIERDIIDKAQPMPEPRSAIMPLIRGDAAGVLGRLDLWEQISVIAFFDPEEIVTPIRVQGLHVGGMGTQRVCGDDKLEVRMSLPQLGHQALGSLTFAIIRGRPITVHERLRHERHDGPLVRRDERGAHHLRHRGDGPMAVHPV